MNLLIDVGNSEIKWAYWRADQVIGEIRIQGRMRTRGYHIESLLAQNEPDQIVVANVAGDRIQNQLATDIGRRLSTPVRFLKTQDGVYGLKLAYADIESLGVDRWLAMIACMQWPETSKLVVDAGTAMTMDIVDHQGRHHGGVILPGSDALGSALAVHTVGVDTTAEQSDLDLGHSTRQCVNIGIEIAQSGAVEYIYHHVGVKLDADIRCVMTGGHASRIKARLAIPCTEVEGLVLQGMAMIVRRS